MSISASDPRRWLMESPKRQEELRLEAKGLQSWRQKFIQPLGDPTPPLGQEIPVVLRAEQGWIGGELVLKPSVLATSDRSLAAADIVRIRALAVNDQHEYA